MSQEPSIKSRGNLHHRGSQLCLVRCKPSIFCRMQIDTPSLATVVASGPVFGGKRQDIPKVLMVQSEVVSLQMSLLLGFQALRGAFTKLNFANETIRCPSIVVVAQESSAIPITMCISALPRLLPLLPLRLHPEHTVNIRDDTESRLNRPQSK